MKKFWIVLVALGLMVPGCGWFQTKGEKTAPELASEGMESFSKGKYKESIEHFSTLRDWYPFSKYAILAELKIADAHYALKEYDDAIYAYEEFENLHPRNEATPYVVYRIGRCYFDRIDTIDRDQTMARKAIDNFSRLLRQFPGNAYANIAREHINRSLHDLAAHDFYVGRFYFKSKHYEAALERFKTVVTGYPDMGVHHQALQFIPRCEEKLADLKEKEEKKK